MACFLPTHRCSGHLVLATLGLELHRRRGVLPVAQAPGGIWFCRVNGCLALGVSLLLLLVVIVLVVLVSSVLLVGIQCNRRCVCSIGIHAGITVVPSLAHVEGRGCCPHLPWMGSWNPLGDFVVVRPVRERLSNPAKITQPGGGRGHIPRRCTFCTLPGLADEQIKRYFPEKQRKRRHSRSP